MPIYLEKSRRNPRRLTAKRRRAKANPTLYFYDGAGVCHQMEAHPLEVAPLITAMGQAGYRLGPPPQAQSQYQAQYQAPAQAQFQQEQQQPQAQQQQEQSSGGRAAFEAASEQTRRRRMASDAQADATKKKRRRTRVARDLYDMVALSMGGLPVVCGPSACMNYLPSAIFKEDVSESPIRGPSSLDKGSHRIGGTATASAMMDLYKVTPADIEAIATLMSGQRVLLRSSSQQSPAGVSMAKQIFKKYMEDAGKPVTLPGEAASNPRRRRRRYYL
jgi:hypothetical protein